MRGARGNASGPNLRQLHVKWLAASPSLSRVDYPRQPASVQPFITASEVKVHSTQKQPRSYLHEPLTTISNSLVTLQVTS